MSQAVAVQATTGASQPLPFRRDDDGGGFPVAGALLLFVLMAVAVWLAWVGKRRHAGTAGSVSRIGRLLAGRFGAPENALPQVTVIASTRLDAATRVYVVAWRGRELLVGVTGSTAPVVLDRCDVDKPPEAAT